MERFRTFCYQYIWYFKLSKKEFCEKAELPLDFFEHIDELDEEYKEKYFPNIVKTCEDMPYQIPDE